jgi:hypothetical protein
VDGKAGITEEQLHDLTRFETSPHFNDRERLVLRLVTAMTHTPADVPDELFAALRNNFSEREMVELSSAIAGKLSGPLQSNVAIEAEGFSKGHFCPLAER